MNKFSIIFGGTGVGHDVSVRGFINVFKNIDPQSLERNGLELKRIIYVSKSGIVYSFVYDPNLDVRAYLFIAETLYYRDYACVAEYTGFSDLFRFLERVKLYPTELGTIYNLVNDDFGEDGTFSAMFDLAGIPHTGNAPSVDALTTDKHFSNIVAENISLHAANSSIFEVPFWMCIDSHSDLPESKLKDFIVLCNTQSFIVKAATLGGSVYVRKFTPQNPNDLSSDEIQELLDYLRTVFKNSPRAIIQEYIEGDNLTVTVLNKKGKFHSATPMLLNIEEDGYLSRAAHTGKVKVSKTYVEDTEENRNLKSRIESSAKALVCAAGITQVCRVDFRVDSNNNIWFLEYNTIPGFSKGTYMSETLWQFVGTEDTMAKYIRILIDNALARKERTVRSNPDDIQYATPLEAYIQSFSV